MKLHVRFIFVLAFLFNVGVARKLCCFRLFLERKVGKERPELLRLGFLGKISANKFAFLDAEGNTSRP